MPYDMEENDHGGGGGDDYHKPSEALVKQAALIAAKVFFVADKCPGCGMAMLGEYALSRSLGYAINTIKREGGTIDDTACMMRETLQHVTDEAIAFAKSLEKHTGGKEDA